MLRSFSVFVCWKLHELLTSASNRTSHETLQLESTRSYYDTNPYEKKFFYRVRKIYKTSNCKLVTVECGQVFVLHFVGKSHWKIKNQYEIPELHRISIHQWYRPISFRMLIFYINIIAIEDFMVSHFIPFQHCINSLILLTAK